MNLTQASRKVVEYEEDFTTLSYFTHQREKYGEVCVRDGLAHQVIVVGEFGFYHLNSDGECRFAALLGP